jgi:Fur family transcriptional regulator, iron response regulator
MNCQETSSIVPAEAVADLLRRRGIIPTAQRVLIGQELLLRPQHVSAEQLLARVNAKGDLVSKATVYNTLGLFAEKGLIREVIIDPSKLFYDTNTSPHHHMYCLDDGTLEDVASEDVGIQRLPDLPSGLRVEGVDVVIRVRRT